MKRIISLILVVVMSALALVGCGYSYAEDDLTQYVTFDKAAFEAALKKIQIEDGDFTMDEETRQKEVLDYINELLVKKVDTSEKLYEGVAIPSLDDLNNNKVYYCYYVTTTAKDKDNNDVAITVYASSMKETGALGVQAGLSDLDDVSKKVEEVLTGVDFKDHVYKTKTSGKAETDKVAYITYTVEYKGASGTVKDTHTNVRVTLGDHADKNGIHNYVAKSIVDKNINTSIDVAAENADDANTKRTYSGVKIDWVVETESEYTFTHTYDTEKKVTATDDEKYDLKDLTLTYHIFPVYYLDVEDLSADAIVKTLTTASSIVSGIEAALEDTETAEEDKVYYRTFKECVELLNAYVELETKVTEAEKAHTTAEEAEKKLQEAYDKTKTALEEAQKNVTNPPEGSNAADLQSKLETAQKNEASALEALNKAKDETAAKKTELDKAEADADAKLTEAYAKAGNNDAEAGKAALVKEYKELTYDNLLATYNNEIKMALAKEIWAAMQSSVTNLKDEEGKNLHPRKAVKEVYDRLYESYENTFYTGTESTSKQTYYKYYGGRFEDFLKKQTGADTFENAKHAVWADAEEYVEDILVVYSVSNAYGKTLDKKAIKEYKKDPEGNYNSYEYYQGETNAIVAYQFDTLLNYFLESEEDDKGEVTYTNTLLPTREQYIKKDAE